MIPIEMYLYGFPIWAVVATVLFVMTWLLMPGSARTRFKARLKGNCVLVSLFSDEGFEKTEIMYSDLGQGILTGNPVSYLFTPRPPTITETTQTDEEKSEYDLATDPDEIKANLDEALLNRMYSDTGKPYYLAYIGKSVAVTPALLKIIADTNKKKTLKLKDGEEPKVEVKKITLLDPRTLKTYVSKTFSRSLIESIKLENQREGFLRRPVQDALKKFGVPFIVIVILILGALVLTGEIDLNALIPF